MRGCSTRVPDRSSEVREVGDVSSRWSSEASVTAGVRLTSRCDRSAQARSTGPRLLRQAGVRERHPARESEASWEAAGARGGGGAAGEDPLSASAGSSPPCARCAWPARAPSPQTVVCAPASGRGEGSGSAGWCSKCTSSSSSPRLPGSAPETGLFGDVATSASAREGRGRGCAADGPAAAAPAGADEFAAGQLATGQMSAAVARCTSACGVG
mmetsp:Transcript_3967/g.11714  ORF Transcript_3967/g.11714 Transcript_3967/m.11714 type:complete len:213 (+) Transcript_3967:530-1168(+)